VKDEAPVTHADFISGLAQLSLRKLKQLDVLPHHIETAQLLHSPHSIRRPHVVSGSFHFTAIRNEKLAFVLRNVTIRRLHDLFNQTNYRIAAIGLRFSPNPAHATPSHPNTDSRKAHADIQHPSHNHHHFFPEPNLDVDFLTAPTALPLPRENVRQKVRQEERRLIR